MKRLTDIRWQKRRGRFLQRRIDFLDQNLLKTKSASPQSKRHERFLLNEVVGIQRLRDEAAREYEDLLSLLIRIDTAFCTLDPEVWMWISYHAVAIVLTIIHHAQKYALEGPGHLDDRWNVNGWDSDEETDVDEFVAESECSASSESSETEDVADMSNEFVAESECSDQ